jgi:hypothetical protein
MHPITIKSQIKISLPSENLIKALIAFENGNKQNKTNNV